MITALTLNRDEPTLIQSIDSIIHMVDKLVLIDASQDKTLYQKAITRYQTKIIARTSEPNIKKQCRIAHNLIDPQSWILRWDADFIAYPELETRLEAYTKLEGQIGVRYYCQDERSKRPHSKYKQFHREVYLFKNSPKFNEPHLRRILGELTGHRHSNIFAPFPYGYTLINSHEILFLHQDQKPDWRKNEKSQQIERARSTK